MKKTKLSSDYERMRSGKFYDPTDPYLVSARTRARCIADKYNRTKAWNIPCRERLIKRLIKNHGKNFFFEPTIHVEYGLNITFGDDFYMNFDCQLLDVCPITIGNGVMFGPRVIVATPCHPMLAEERMAKQYPDGYHDLEYGKPVVIGDNVWVASGTLICGGVSIGDNAVIGAGSVVTRDIPSGVFAAGNPCRTIRPLTDADKMDPWDSYIRDTVSD